MVTAFWVIFINLTSSFSALLSGISPVRFNASTFNALTAAKPACIEVAFSHPFYGIQGKFSEG
jgi:hypothetical protein